MGKILAVIAALLPLVAGAQQRLVVQGIGELVGDEYAPRYVVLTQDFVNSPEWQDLDGRIDAFLSANMSIGVALLADLAKKAAAVFPDADIEIIERHHNQKVDVPSGTALLLARRIQEVRPEAELVVGRHENGKRTPTEIGIHSLRYGSEVGTHEIILSNGSETVTLKHEAESRVLFARGAVAAAEFIVGKAPGLYDMRDIIA